MSEQDIAAMAAEWNTPPMPTNGPIPTFDDFVKEQGGNFNRMKDLPYGEHKIKFMGVSMVSTKFGHTPEYHFEIEGKEFTLLSKSKRLFKLKGQEGSMVRVLKQRNQVKGWDEWLVL